MLTGFLPAFSHAVETEAERNATYLLGLSLEELIKVEVTLDEVFNVFDGLIETKKVTVATGKWQPTDRAPAVTTVITAQDIEAMGAGLLGNYAFVKVTDEQQQDSGNYPRHSGYLRVDYLLHPHWYLDLSMNWVADRKRVFGDIRPQIADYTTVNLTIRYKDIRGGHQYFALGLRNLLDTAAYEPSPGPDSSGVVSIPNDLPLAGRNFFVEFRYQF